MTWHLIAGVAIRQDGTQARAASPYDMQSFVPASFGGFTVDPSTSQIYRIGGRYAGGGYSDAVWTSTDGKSWSNHITSSSQKFSPLRDETVAVANTAGHLFLMGGRTVVNGNSQCSSPHHFIRIQYINLRLSCSAVFFSSASAVA